MWNRNYFLLELIDQEFWSNIRQSLCYCVDHYQSLQLLGAFGCHKTWERMRKQIFLFLSYKTSFNFFPNHKFIHILQSYWFKNLIVQIWSDKTTLLFLGNITQVIFRVKSFLGLLFARYCPFWVWVHFYHNILSNSLCQECCFSLVMCIINASSDIINFSSATFLNS